MDARPRPRGPQGSWPVEHFWSKLWECTAKFPSNYDVSSLQVPNYIDYDLIITDSNIYPNMCSTFLVPGPSPLVAGWSSYLALWSLGTERLGTEVFHIGSTWLHIDQILSKQHPPFFGRTMGAPELKKMGVYVTSFRMFFCRWQMNFGRNSCPAPPLRAQAEFIVQKREVTWGRCRWQGAARSSGVESLARGMYGLRGARGSSKCTRNSTSQAGTHGYGQHSTHIHTH